MLHWLSVSLHQDPLLRSTALKICVARSFHQLSAARKASTATSPSKKVDDEEQQVGRMEPTPFSSDAEGPGRELYALLHIPPEADDDDIKRAYRQWAQVYHPDKHQTVQMQDIATQNFQRIREAYEILTDPRRRQIYDLYGMEGLTSGLELGPRLKSQEDIRREFDRMERRKQERSLASHVNHAGSLVLDVHAAQFVKSFRVAPKIFGMSMSTSVQAPLSGKDTAVIGGNIALRRGMGGGSVILVLRRQLSTSSWVEVVGMTGLRSILCVQASRQVTSHSTAMVGATWSLRDGSLSLANGWTRELNKGTTASIQLVLGPDTEVVVGWQHQGHMNGGTGEIKVAPTTLGVSGQYIRHFTPRAHGRLSAKVGTSGIEVEIGGERRVSEHSSAAMFCTMGLRGVSWKVRYTRGSQKFVIPILISSTLSPYVCLCAMLVPSSIYALLHICLLQPYQVRRHRRKTLEQRRSLVARVLEGRATSQRSQALLLNVAERKRRKQAEKNGLIIYEALYGNLEDSENTHDSRYGVNEGEGAIGLPPPNLDVRIPLQFLIGDSDELRLHEGVRKAGLIGFCDPCPGEPKQLRVAYKYQGNHYKVVVGDTRELVIPQEAHRVSSGNEQEALVCSANTRNSAP